MVNESDRGFYYAGSSILHLANLVASSFSLKLCVGFGFVDDDSVVR